MAIVKAKFQNFDNRFESHWVSLVPTVFRRFVRPICVGFLPLEMSPGGFCFQVSFRIRFPKPPWNFFFRTILPVIGLLCFNEVTTKSDNIWHQSYSPTMEIQFKSDVSSVIICNTLSLRLILMVSIPIRELFVSPGNFLSRQHRLLCRLSRLDHSDRATISVGLDSCHFTTGKSTLLQSWVLRSLVMDNTYLDEFVEIGIILDLIVTLGFPWRLVIRRFAMFGISPCGFQSHWKRRRGDLLTVRKVLRGFNERFICGNLYHNIGFNTLEDYLQTGQMRILTQWLGVYEFKEIKENMVANEQSYIRRYRRHDPEPSQATYQSILSIKVMRKAFRSFIYKMIACYECMKRGLNRFILLPVRLLLESRVTSTSSSKLGFNFLYLFQWLYLNGFMYHVSCKTFMK